MKIQFIKFILRAMVGIVFIIAGFEKVLQPDAFAAAIRNYHLVPDSLVNILALGIPMVELGAGLCLFFGIKPRIMGGLIGLLLLSFLGVMSFALWRGEPISCGCFLGDEASIGAMWFSFLRDWALLAVTLGVIALYAEPREAISSTAVTS